MLTPETQVIRRKTSSHQVYIVLLLFCLVFTWCKRNANQVHTRYTQCNKTYPSSFWEMPFSAWSFRVYISQSITFQQRVANCACYVIARPAFSYLKPY